jgi:hypothetical protein
MSAVSLTAVGQLKGQTAPYSLASITGTVYDSAGTTFTIPTPKSLVFFRGKTFTPPYTVPSMVNPISPVAGNGQVALSWSAPDNGGSSITGYTVKYSNGTVITTTAAGTTSYTVTGLTNGTSYTFIVIANNSVGSSLPNSSPSATPVAPVNALKITSVTGGVFGFLPGFTDYRADYTTVNGIGGLPAINYTYQMTGGNSSPIYIYYDTSSINGTTGIQLNNVYYDNLGDISVYFPNGIVNATSAHYNAFNGGCMRISQTEPVDKQRARASQDANGNPIGSPTRY